MATYNDSSTPGFTFTVDNTSLTILAGELYGSTRGHGIVGDVSGNTLTNNGNILGGFGDGVQFLSGTSGPSNRTVINNAGASIIGQSNGILLNGDQDTVTNFGTVMGLTAFGVIAAESSDHIVITNRGEIYGQSIGIAAASVHEGGTIDNFGIIRSDFVGIYVTTDTGVAIITNEAGGAIRGSHGSLQSLNSGAVHLVNAGTLQGKVLLEASNQHDMIINRVAGVIQGNVFFGSGNDTYNGLGGGKVTGTIFGEAGTDTFLAGRAREVFNGGADADTFVFRSAAFSAAGTSRDTIGGFIASGAGHDHIDMRAMDSDATHAGLQHFAFIGTDTFAHFHSLHPGAIGMLRFNAASHTLQGNVNGNFSNAEFEVGLPGVNAFAGGDLILA